MSAPLAGLRLLDLSRQLPGPFCSTLLADLGMDVLVIAAPDDPFGVGIPFLARRKRSMTLNLKAEAGRDIFRRLVADADVVLEGFRPGVTTRLGIDYETLRRDNPRLIYCAITGFGQDGPYRDRAGHDLNYLGWAGVLNYIGETGRPPIVPGVQIADIGGGSLMAAIGILAAIVARVATGRGQLVDVAMTDGALAWNVYHVLLQQVAGRPPVRGGEQVTGGWPCFAVYETGDGRYVTVAAYEPHFWANLCRHFGREDFVADQWADGERRDEMFRFFRAAFRTRTMAAWVAELADADICFGPVNTLEEALVDPQLTHRGMVLDLAGPTGRWRAPGLPITLADGASASPGSLPRFGEHTAAVLRELGFGDAEIAELRAARVV